jgi:aromatic amino acid aminotransferase I
MAHTKDDRVTPLFSFSPPVGGMFLWCTLYYSVHPTYQRLASSSEDPEGDFEKYLWNKLADANVLVTPGRYYRPWMGDEAKSVRERVGIGYFRLAFSYENKANMEEGIKRLSAVMHQSL